MSSSFVDACAQAPVGVALLAHLESQQVSDSLLFNVEREPTPDTVSQAIGAVEQMSFGELCAVSLRASDSVGPWFPDAPVVHDWARRQIDPLVPIADAIDTQFGEQLHAPINLGDQQWWFGAMGPSAAAPVFANLDDVYGNGEFTWGALRAFGAPPEETLEIIGGAMPTPLTRWRLPVTASPRVFEIHRPQDWRALCMAYPRHATRRSDWPLQPHDATQPVNGHIAVNWSAVATDFDAVHLSWAGFITSEGCVLTEPDSGMTMQRYWFSEVTHWIQDLFGQPEPIETPINGFEPSTRRNQDQQWIATYLGRQLQNPT